MNIGTVTDEVIVQFHAIRVRVNPTVYEHSPLTSLDCAILTLAVHVAALRDALPAKVESQLEDISDTLHAIRRLGCG